MSMNPKVYNKSPWMSARRKKRNEKKKAHNFMLALDV